MSSVGEQLMHNDAKGPDVYALRILLIKGNLWRHVHEGTHMIIIRRLRLVSKPEVDNLDLRILIIDRALIDQYVRCLQVSVNNTLIMDV